jgi:hypothetical protein
MSLNTAQRYLKISINTLSGSLQYFLGFSIYVGDIRNMLRSVTEPNAPLPRQKLLSESTSEQDEYLGLSNQTVMSQHYL